MANVDGTFPLSVSGDATTDYEVFFVRNAAIESTGNTAKNPTDILAVEIHQESDTSSDVSFDLRLHANVPAPVEVRLLAAGETWRYLDNGSNQGTTWRETNFDDSAWPQGRAEFGYGDSDETTELDENNRQGSRVRTFYFRRDLDVSNPENLETILLDILYDVDLPCMLTASSLCASC